MLLPIKPICKKTKMRRDGTSLICIQYCLRSEKRTEVSTGISIPPAFWNRKSLKVTSDLPAVFGVPDVLNNEVKRMTRLAEDIVSFAIANKIPDPLHFLKKTFRPDFDISRLEEKAKEVEEPNINLDVFFQIEEYINSKRKQVTPKMINVYNNMRDTLKAFQDHRKTPISFESFDFNFYEEFVDYMTYEHIQRRRKEIVKGFKISTIGKTIKQLRIFLRNRIRRKIIAPINLEDFRILDEETDAVYLTLGEINHIYEMDLSAHPYLCKYRDLFVFGCLTGLRFSDFSTISSDDVRGRMLYKKQNKSDHWVVIPLRDEAYNIFMNYKKNIPNITNSDFNFYIKEVAKLAGINALIKFSHKKGNKDFSHLFQQFLFYHILLFQQ